MFLSFLCLLLPAASAWGPSPSFDCAMRKLAYKYGKQLIPRKGNFESLYYALDLNDPNCPGVMLNSSDHSSTPSATNPLPEGLKLFVHPISGNDANQGTMKSPFRTIQAALDRAALVDPTPAVVLRGGVHYIADTLVLTPKHSGLHLIGYPGEKATVSGGDELRDLSWKPYNVTPPAPSPPGPKPCTWTTQDGYNYVRGYKNGNPNFPTLGLPSKKEDCEALCKADSKCHAYTWHDEHQGRYAKRCVGRLDGHYRASREAGHFSGHDASATPGGPSPSPTPPAGPPNIYVTDVKNDFGGAMLGLQIDGKRATIARYPNQPGGVETSCGYGCMVSGRSASWTPPDFNKYGKVTYYTDMNPDHKRNDSARGGGLDNWFSHYMID